MTLFAFFGIWWLAGAVGAAAISIPVIIHLINRRRFKIVDWAAMKFLLAAQKQTRKRMRIEQLLLLLVRMLVIALLVFAMSAVMPWAESLWAGMGLAKFAKPTRTQRIHHVFVLDASLSMNQMIDGQPAFEVARQLALRKIQDNSSGDGYSVLLLKDSPTWLIGEASQDVEKVKRLIRDIKPSHGNSSMGSALNMVSAKLTEARSRFPTQAVYFFTDMQRTTWLGAAPSEFKTEPESKERHAYLDIQERATTVLIDVGKEGMSNLAATDIAFNVPYVTANSPVALTVGVHNFSNDPKRNVRVELLLGKAKDNANDPALQMRVVDQKPGLNFDQGQRRMIDFDDFKFPAAGTYVVQVKVADDALMEDNTRAVVITVRDTIPVLLVNGKPSADRFERATEYLRLALNPFPPGEEKKWAPLRPKVVSPSQFSSMTEAELEPFDCIYWCDVGQFSTSDVRKIDAHVRRGGGFVVTLGEKAVENLHIYNRLLYKDEQGLLPAKLMQKVVAPAEHHFYFQNTDANAFTLPPLSAFSDDQDRLTLRTVRFREFIESVVPEGKARVVLSFMPEVANIEKVKRVELPLNKPAIVEWNPPLVRAHQNPVDKAKSTRGEKHLARYRGKVVLLTSAANMDWSNWPGSPSFGAMMHELTRLSVSGRLREQAHTVGGAFEEYLPGNTEVDVTVHMPAKTPGTKSVRKRTQMIDEVNLFRFPDPPHSDTDFSGIYRVETPGSHEIPFAVNVPVSASDHKWSESDLRRIDSKELKEICPDWNLQIVRDPLMAAIELNGNPATVSDVPQPVGPTFANIALLIVLGLLFTEILMAWYFGHYTTTEGALSGAPPGPTSTVLAIAIAVMSSIFFAIGAAVIYHGIITGDFVSFLPDMVRNWIERQVGADPLLAGEGSVWKYERNPFLFGMPGSEVWYSILITIGAVVTIFFTYKAEAPKVTLLYKLLLGALRFYLILLTLWFLLPRSEVRYDREGWPDMVLLIDDSRSMGEPDAFQDPKVLDRANKLGDLIRDKLTKEIPGKISALREEIAKKSDAAQKDIEVKAEVDALRQRLQYWEKQSSLIDAGKWRPSRLQLIQAILMQPEPHWLKSFLTKTKTKVHVFHLTQDGKATKLRDLNGDAGELIDPSDNKALERTLSAIWSLEPHSNDSRLGTALKEVINHYRGSSLSSVVMFTDGVTTRDETVAQVADYAAGNNVSLYFIGIGDQQQLRDLRLHDLQCEDTIYIGDNAIFEARLTGEGYKDLVVPIVLRVRDAKDKDGKGKEVAREMVKVDPNGKSVKIRLRDQPKSVGRKTYSLEVELPKTDKDKNEKPIPPANLRLERTIDVIDTKLIKVLYVEGQPRYEFRYIKFLMEREMVDTKKKKKSIDLTVLLLDADPDWAAKDRKDDLGVDKTAIRNFPPTLEDLNQYDVLLFGDCDPNHQKLQHRLKDIVHFVRGEDANGKKAQKAGGGILFMAGAFHNPHRYKTTPLASILPVEPLSDKPPPDVARVDQMRPELTPVGRLHPIFRFSPDEGASLAIWSRLTPMHWNSTGYRLKPLAEVLAVAPGNEPIEKRHALAVQQYVGTGRSMFFGFDETWRWRLREDESKFNNFWIQTVRYLSRGRSLQTNLRLDKQTPYKLGEPIKITVTFPESSQGGDGPKVNEKDVKITVQYLPPDAKEREKDKEKDKEGEVHSLQLAKVEGSRGQYEGTWNRTREGKWRFWLSQPDVRDTQPDGEKPSAEAIVELPPGELDKLRMNAREMDEAATNTQGKFYTVVNADDALNEIPRGMTPIFTGTLPPTALWNQWWVFVVALFLITSEWVLRKWKHLL